MSPPPEPPVSFAPDTSAPNSSAPDFSTPDFDPVAWLQKGRNNLAAWRKTIEQNQRPQVHRQPQLVEDELSNMAKPMAKKSIAKRDPTLDKLLSSPVVKFTFPDLAPYPSPMQCRELAPYHAKRVQFTLHSMADDLYNHLKLSELWNKTLRDGHNDLLWFLHRVNLEKPTTPASAVRTTAKDMAFGSFFDEELPFPLTLKISPNTGRMRRRVTPLRFGDLTDFEDLYYMIWHKVLTVYQDLRVRYACGFISRESVIHHHGVTLREEKPFTVKELSWFLQAAWAELTDPQLIVALDSALGARYLQEDLVPGYDPQKHSLEDELRIRQAYSNRGQNLLKPLQYSPGLKDLSSASPVEIINQVYTKHKIIRDCEKVIEQSNKTEREVRKAGIKFLQQRTQARTAGPPQPAPDDPKSYPCECKRGCICKDLCTVEPNGGCLCRMWPEFYSAYELDEFAGEQLECETGTAVGESYLFGTPSNEFAQMQVAAIALSRHPVVGPELTRAASDVQDEMKKLEVEFAKVDLEKAAMTPAALTPRMEKLTMETPAMLMTPSLVASSQLGTPEPGSEPNTPSHQPRKRLAGSIRSRMNLVKRIKQT
ncbi:hypothetical protein NA57DRAFT_79258 [Rhizodiscina lignyota]|uniref:Uncharacterized protein n=1 Tax=Rhizodiscina lignyota TaxID=1504668 RepID=A0A9P4IBI8_9PEZI|nr:hypothetical protein NA57DRAFT_79258 [Rhizodiscina lignyota]